jgi:hypothetical protein
LATENRQKGVAFSLDLRFRGSSGFVYLYKWEAWSFLIHYRGEMGRTVLPVLFSLSLLPLLSSHGGRGKGREEESLIKKKKTRVHWRRETCTMAQRTIIDHHFC